jgi:hypothetical protein
MADKKIDIQNIIITKRQDVVNSYNGESVGDYNLRVLDMLGIWPLTYGNKKTRVLNGLGLIVYLSGNLSSSNGRVLGTISGKFNGKQDLRETWKEELGLGFSPQDGYIAFGKNGQPIGRTLISMGFFVSTGKAKLRHNQIKRTKASVGSSLPQYLIELVDNYDALNNESKKLAMLYLQDLVNVMFDTRSYIDGNSIHLRLIKQPSKKRVQEQAYYLMNAFNKAYPNVHLKPWENIDTYPTNYNGTHAGRLILHLEDIIKIAQMYPDGPVSYYGKGRISITPPVYSFMNLS